ncbi:MAG: hydrogenase expression/formation protein HypE [Bacteroidales bacterium]|nr:hydrogenase expression/formation protein HypE [Bacteroidales bacterium]
MNNEIIRIGHGSGGRLSRELINDIFLRYFNNATLKQLNDAASLSVQKGRIAFTTDSYVIDPIFFPGGDIGQLAVSGTVNDLCVSGAIPKFLSAGFIIEEGFSLINLEKIVASMAREAKKAGVEIVTGDTKVVRRGQVDKIFINTSGIGIIPEDRFHLSEKLDPAPGDKIIITGTLGDHSIAILSAREKIPLDEIILSDAEPLTDLVNNVLRKPEEVLFMRDITRGGLATVLVEICENLKFGIEIKEADIPVFQSVKSVCELYGFDPLYLANEGKIVMIVKTGSEQRILDRIKSYDPGNRAAIIGEITIEHPSKVVIKSIIGGRRVVDMLSGEMLPRIC